MTWAVVKIVRVFLRKLREDKVSAFAAQTAFFILLSFIPFLMFLLTFLRFLPISDSDLVNGLEGVLPPAIYELVAVIIHEVLSKTSTAIASVSVITALWSASRGFLVIVQGLNEVYGKPETRNYFVVRMIATIDTVVFAVLLLVTLLLLGFGNQIYLYIEDRIPILSDAAFLVISLRTIVLLLILVLYFLILYLVVPDRRSSITEELPGALVCAGGWLLFSFLFSFYIDHLANFSAMYGSLTAIVLCMLWLYACMYLMFIGAEVNVALTDSEVRECMRRISEKLEERKRRVAARKNRRRR